MSYVDHTELDVPVAAAWAILTSRDGARQWLDDMTHPGIDIGAKIQVPGAGPATVTAMEPETLVKLALADGEEARLVFSSNGEGKCRLAVEPGGRDCDARGWAHIIHRAWLVTKSVKEEREPRQAVVVIHGIGNQKPLATANRFVNALVDREERWSKPDRLSSSYEMRRYQVKKDRGQRRPATDVYELYWADKVPGTVVGHSLAWLRGQLLRWPRDVSPALRPLVIAAQVAVVSAIIALVGLVITVGIDDLVVVTKLAWASAILSLLSAIVSSAMIKSVGDAARYLHPDPANIGVRQTIREAGITLLRRLHTEASYHRIVIVGHSLGSVIAYDLVRHYWAEVHLRHGSPAGPNQELLKKYESALDVASGDAHRSSQTALWEENRRHGVPWLITDLVTLGSPLTHAVSLLAPGKDGLEELQRDFELPTCPPRPDGPGITRKCTYVVAGGRRTISLLTHGCPFAVTRWTNLYAPVTGVVFGDIVGGPVAPAFGAGVKDVPVRVPGRWRRSTLFAHTAYWHRSDDPADDAILELKRAIDLGSLPWLTRMNAHMPWRTEAGDQVSPPG